MPHPRVKIETFQLAGLGLVGTSLLAATLMVLVWPGPVALTDRIPLGLLFGIPMAVTFYRLKRRLE